MSQILHVLHLNVFLDQLSKNQNGRQGQAVRIEPQTSSSCCFGQVIYKLSVVQERSTKDPEPYSPFQFENDRSTLKGRLCKWGGGSLEGQDTQEKKHISFYTHVFLGSPLQYSFTPQLQNQVADGSPAPGMRRQRVKRSRVAQMPSTLLGISTGQQHARSELLTNVQISCKVMPWLS